MEKKDWDELLDLWMKNLGDVSDINLTPGRPVQGEFHGELRSFGNLFLSSYQTWMFANFLMGSKDNLEKFQQQGYWDGAYQSSKFWRFRVHIFLSRTGLSLVLRKLPLQVPTLKDLGLPETFVSIAKEKQGLILLSGPTGSGKSTTLAAILDEINRTQKVHIVTLEDPVEFLHKPFLATFNQRELGLDFYSLASGLKAALRQAPKVILVGELRDEESAQMAISASETGHLVLATVHGGTVSQGLQRFIGLFPGHKEEQIRYRLSSVLRWFICQKLVHTQEKSYPIHEIMGHNLRSAELIARGEDEIRTFHRIMSSSEALGWNVFEKDLLKLVETKRIDEKTAMIHASKLQIMRHFLDNAYLLENKDLLGHFKNVKIDKNYTHRTTQV